MHTTLAFTDRAGKTVTVAGLAVLCTAIAYAAVNSPWLVSGAVFGVLLLMLVVARPLALVALMLVLGPADLSFLTGGFKSLFAGVGGLDMNGIRLLGVTGGFMLLMAHSAVQHEAFGKYGRWYVLFLIWAGASLATSYSPVEGLRLLFKLAYPFLMFVVVAGLVDKEEQLDRLMAWTIGAAAVIVLINPLLLFGVAFQVDDAGYKRIGGLGTYANPFSFYLMVIVFMSLARFVVRGQFRYLALCVILGLWIYMTLTRITLLGVVAGAAVMGIYGAIAARRFRILIGAALVTGLVVGPFVPVVLERSLGFVPTPKELAAISSNPSTLYESVNWEGREFLWPVVWKSFGHDRLTGLGLGSTAVVLRQTMPAHVGVLVHNEYLRLFAEAGLIGCLLFFIAISKWLAGAWRAAWRADARTREFGLAAIAAIIGWAVVALTDNPFDYYASLTQYVGFLVAGTLVSARLAARSATEAQA